MTKDWFFQLERPGFQEARFQDLRYLINAVGRCG